MDRFSFSYWMLLCFLSAFLADKVVGEEPKPSAESLEFFEKKVRPLLATHCYECHSEQAKRLEGGLYLDRREDLLSGGDSGPAIEPGDPESSLLISAVRYDAFEMPPKGKLSDAEVAILHRWVEEGAPWPAESTARVDRGEFNLEQRKQSHWAWQLLQPVEVPTTANSEWPRNEIDHFILDRLEQEELVPAGPANRAALVRRLYFDLIGLPPTAAEVREFCDDPDPQAYEKLVERLLGSKHFGEKWARHWLDLVRYGETLGHEFDYPLHDAYQYRDYLIRAFNQDVPYNTLLTEHLAGDLMSPPRRHLTEGYNESIIGTGFWFLGEAIHAPTDVRADEADRIDNQLDVMSKTFLALTVACSRCHDHKFDPIPTADYYSLAGFLQSSRRQHAMLDPGQRIAQAALELHERAADLDQSLQQVRPSGGSLSGYLLPGSGGQETATETGSNHGQEEGGVGQEAEVRRRLKDLLASEATADPRHPLYLWRFMMDASPEDFANRKQEVQRQLVEKEQAAAKSSEQIQWFEDFRDGGFEDWYVTGEAFGEAPVGPGQVDVYAGEPRFATEYRADSGRLGKKLQGVLRSPTFVLEHSQIHYRMRADKARVRLIVDGYVMDEFNALLFADITLENVDTKGETSWVTQRNDLYHYVGHRAHLEIIDHGDGFAAVDRIGFSDGGPPIDPPNALVMQLSRGDWDSHQDLADAYQQQFERSLDQLEAGELSDEAAELLNLALELGALQVDRKQWQAIVESRNAIDATVPAPMKVIALEDGDGENDRIHIRGSHENLGDVVPRQMLQAIAGTEQPAVANGSGRLELANRMVDPSNPFVSRVLVNRVWHHLFGRGIVPTVDDFGAMGQPASHPELLDWLAIDFMEQGWSIKHVIRQIVMSKTYQMTSSYPDREAVATLDPDNVLLHRAPIRRLPAESIRDAMLSVAGALNPKLYGPSVPVHLSQFMEGRGRPSNGPLDGEGRRSIYIRIQRNFLSPMMLAFDMPSPFSTMGRRSNSNVPAQSLILMNDPFVWQQAERWAQKIMSDSAMTTDQRIEMAFESALGRLPTPSQLQRVHRFVEDQAEVYQSDVNDPRVWTDVCHAILNMKEFIYLN